LREVAELRKELEVLKEKNVAGFEQLNSSMQVAINNIPDAVLDKLKDVLNIQSNAAPITIETMKSVMKELLREECALQVAAGIRECKDMFRSLLTVMNVDPNVLIPTNNPIEANGNSSVSITFRKDGGYRDPFASGDQPFPYFLFKWSDESTNHMIPCDFNMPVSSTCKQIWDLWYHGNAHRNIRPLRNLNRFEYEIENLDRLRRKNAHLDPPTTSNDDGNHSKTKIKKHPNSEYFSKISKVISALVEFAIKSGKVQSESEIIGASVEKSDDVYYAAYGKLRSAIKELNSSESLRDVKEDLCYGTVYNKLGALKKKSNVLNK